MLFTFFRCAMFLAGWLCLSSVQAGIVLNTTRVIYQGKDKEVSFGVHNSGGGEILAQSWLEPYNPSGVVSHTIHDLPFMVTPPLARMSGDGKQLLRIIYAGAGMPADRESVLWLNVQEIPQSAAENTLQIAVRQRIKLFFRPVGLSGDPALAAQSLQWRLLPGHVLEAYNPGPYHVSMLRIELHQGSIALGSEESRMLAPQQRWQLPLKPRNGAAPLDLRFISINDFGGQEGYQARLADDRIAQAEKSHRR